MSHQVRKETWDCIPLAAGGSCRKCHLHLRTGRDYKDRPILTLLAQIQKTLFARFTEGPGVCNRRVTCCGPRISSRELYQPWFLLLATQPSHQQKTAHMHSTDSTKRKKRGQGTEGSFDGSGRVLEASVSYQGAMLGTKDTYTSSDCSGCWTPWKIRERAAKSQEPKCPKRPSMKVSAF